MAVVIMQHPCEEVFFSPLCIWRIENLTASRYYSSTFEPYPVDRLFHPAAVQLNRYYKLENIPGIGRRYLALDVHTDQIPRAVDTLGVEPYSFP